MSSIFMTACPQRCRGVTGSHLVGRKVHSLHSKRSLPGNANLLNYPRLVRSQTLLENLLLPAS